MNNSKRTPAITTGTLDGNLIINFAHGKTLAITVAELSPEIREAALLHGLKQKLIDAAAISCNPETGKPASVEDKYNAVLEVHSRLVAGSWNKTRESGGGGASGGLLFRALCELYPRKTSQDIREFLSTKTDKEKAALRANDKVAAIVARIRAESSKSEIDGESLLDELQ